MPTPPDPAPPDAINAARRMPKRVPPDAIGRLLDHATDLISADLAAALLDAVRDIHAACAAHRSHGNRSLPVVDLDIILGRHLRPHLNPTAATGAPTEPDEPTLAPPTP